MRTNWTEIYLRQNRFILLAEFCIYWNTGVCNMLLYSRMPVYAYLSVWSACSSDDRILVPPGSISLPSLSGLRLSVWFLVSVCPKYNWTRQQFAPVGQIWPVVEFGIVRQIEPVSGLSAFLMAEFWSVPPGSIFV